MEKLLVGRFYEWKGLWLERIAGFQDNPHIPIPYENRSTNSSTILVHLSAGFRMFVLLCYSHTLELTANNKHVCWESHGHNWRSWRWVRTFGNPKLIEVTLFEGWQSRREHLLLQTRSGWFAGASWHHRKLPKPYKPTRSSNHDASTARIMMFVPDSRLVPMSPFLYKSCFSLIGLSCIWI